MQVKNKIDEIEYIYNEKFFSGKKELIINGKKLQQVNKKNFVDQQTGEEYIINGSFIKGLTLNTKSKEIVLVKNKWYEWVVIILPLVSIGLGIFCGAIGCALSFLFSFLCSFFNATICRSRKINSTVLKVIICIILAVIFSLAWFGLYWSLVNAILK